MSDDRPRPERSRQERVREWLAAEGCDAAVIVDLESLRDRSLRYLSGHFGDALLFLLGRETLLVPWDLPLAQRLACVDRLTAFERYERSVLVAVTEVLSEQRVRRVELSGKLPFPLVDRLKAALPQTEILCREDGVDALVSRLRERKDPAELARLRQACRITDELLRLVEEKVRDPHPPSEAQLALLLEAEARARGAEGMSFETLAAGPPRSFGIHCFPAVTGGPFASPGLSILDFGVSFEGYGSDVTTTVLRGPSSARQQEMRRAVEAAYALAVSRCRPGEATTEIAAAVNECFASRGFSMPHGLGHGIGLDSHEAPRFRLRPGEPSADSPRLAPGMVFTIEPGLYDPQEGGIRLENDLLVTETGCELLTRSRLIDL